jgi:hypothetical protein
MILINDLVRDAVLVPVIEGVTDVANKVVVRVFLTRVWNLSAVVTSISHSVPITILLFGVRNPRTIVELVKHRVPIRVLAALISNIVSIGVFLVAVFIIRTIVTGIADTVTVFISLEGIGNSWAVVFFSRDSITIWINVASITNTVAISVLLAGVWQCWAIVGNGERAFFDPLSVGKSVPIRVFDATSTIPSRPSRAATGESVTALGILEVCWTLLPLVLPVSLYPPTSLTFSSSARRGTGTPFTPGSNLAVN